ncbi:AAA family ATPase [Paenisporosarcina cavernae]|uniref:Nucleoside kinase n=1 Tax=Paenisporosarcina cavernae TaxID=2320858 RepID=A0A385YV40_9BACL|nr:AAA family ATPase [Paenisporosarcina cavernae]AYC30556.1 nucleoside kinase [Paenisporosarcina cavernae]
MGKRNYLIEGVSCTGKTTVCNELQSRGYHAIHGDRELAYQGDPETGEPTNSGTHENHIWDLDKVKACVANSDEEITFFCGGSRNFSKFIELFDGVFVLDIDRGTLQQRLDERPQNEWGAKKSERDLILRLHETKEDIPKNGVLIDGTKSIEQVVDDILFHCEKNDRQQT